MRRGRDSHPGPAVLHPELSLSMVPRFSTSGRARRRAIRAACAGVGVLSLLACGGRGAGERAGGGKGSAAASAATAAAASASSAKCPMSGEWRLCSVLDRLDRAGLAPQPGTDTVRRSFFSVPGQRIRIGRGTLEVYVYPDHDAMARDVRRLDSASASPPGEHVDWPTPPTLITSNNLAAVLLSSNERAIERVRDAITAGLPPAER